MKSATAVAELSEAARCVVRPYTRRHERHHTFASIAALLGDPARADILTALLDGCALTAKELAFAAHVSVQTTSGHLAKLADAGPLTPDRQGRHRYFRLASLLVGQMLDSVMAVAGPDPSPTRRWRGGDALRTARTCYGHLAGRLGVALADALTMAGHVTLYADGGKSLRRGTHFCAISARSWLAASGYSPTPA